MKNDSVISPEKPASADVLAEMPNERSCRRLISQFVTESNGQFVRTSNFSYLARTAFKDNLSFCLFWPPCPGASAPRTFLPNTIF